MQPSRALIELAESYRVTAAAATTTSLQVLGGGCQISDDYSVGKISVWRIISPSGALLSLGKNNDRLSCWQKHQRQRTKTISKRFCSPLDYDHELDGYFLADERVLGKMMMMMMTMRIVLHLALGFVQLTNFLKKDHCIVRARSQ